MEVPPSVRLRIASIQHCNSAVRFFAPAFNAQSIPSVNLHLVFDDHAGESIGDDGIDGL